MIIRTIFLFIFSVHISYAETFIDREDLSPATLHERLSGSVDNIDQKKYKIKQGDLLDISVKQDPKLNGNYRVHLDNLINFPLIGSIHAKDQTPYSLAKEIENHLAQEFIQNPQVLVIVKEFSLAKIELNGAFYQPGIYSIAEKISLSKAFELGGGPTEFADLSKVELIRNNSKFSGNKEFYDYSSVKSNITREPLLDNGDILIIREFSPITIEGGVNKPGIVHVASNIKLSKLINLVNGFNQMADISTITISKLNLESEWITTVYDYNDFLSGKSPEPFIEPGQKVYVGHCEKKIKFLGKSICIKNKKP